LISDFRAFQLAFGVFVPVQAELGVVGEVGTELQEKRAEVLVHTIEVIVIDQGSGFDDPGIAGVLLRVVTLFGAIDGALLLRFANEDYAIALWKLCAHFGGDLIFALAFFEGYQGDLMIFHELLDGRYEGPGHRLHGVGGQDLGFPLLPDEVQRTFQNLKPSHDDVEIHPVDGFGFQNHMLVQHFRDGLW